MPDEADYERLKLIQKYIEAERAALRADLVPHYKLQPGQFELVLLRAGISIFWSPGTLSEVVVETFLTDQCANALNAKQIINAFAVFQQQITKQSIRDAVSYFHEVYPEYAPQVSTPAGAASPIPWGTSEQGGEHSTGSRAVDPVSFTCALFPGEGYRVFGKVFYAGQLVDGLGQKKHPSNLCSMDLGAKSCQLYKDSVGLAVTSRDSEHPCCPNALLL